MENSVKLLDSNLVVIIHILYNTSIQLYVLNLKHIGKKFPRAQLRSLNIKLEILIPRYF